MIRPINGHILIEPLKHESFISSEKGVYEEIGTVLDNGQNPVKNGTKVYFDSWLAVRYPKNENEFYWLVKWEDVRAIDI